MTITQATEYDWYKAALAGKKPPIHDGDVQSGRFRMKQKDGPAIGVAVWRDWSAGGVMMASYDAKTYVCDEKAEQVTGPDGKPRATNYQRLQDKWTFLSGQFIPPGIFKRYKESGYKKWPDESDSGREQRAATQAEKTNQPAEVTFTHAHDTFDGIKERLDKYGAEAQTLIDKGAAKDGITSDIAADLKVTMTNLEAAADKLRLASTLDLRQQVEKMNKEWNVLVDKAKLLKASLAVKVISPFHAAEVIRLQAEQNARNEVLRQNNIQVTAEMTAAPRVSSGTMNRKVSPRSVCNAKITDPRAFLAFLAGNDQIHAGILAAMQVIADNGGSTDPAKCASYPGVTYEQTKISA